MNNFVKPFLYPVWFIYATIVYFRNTLYDFKFIKSTEFHLPVISIGNITVGGTGKTPHAEYLIRLLKDQFKVAYLSRGYKRKTRDFVLATDQSTSETIGDEPYQIKHKFPNLTVAVDRDRVKGIQKLTDKIPELDIVLLDDAYQHRAVNPGVNILLIDYNNPIYTDSLLPIGRLRERVSEKKRADIIIVTKVPHNITAMERRLFAHNIGLMDHQHLYFTAIKYGEPQPVFHLAEGTEQPDFMQNDLTVLLVTGIANATLLTEELTKGYKQVIPVHYPDHHTFTQSDLTSVLDKFKAIADSNKIILTTEKDAARLKSFENAGISPEAWYYIPIEIEFLATDGDIFNKQILHYVKNNNKNSILYQKPVNNDKLKFQVPDIRYQ